MMIEDTETHRSDDSRTALCCVLCVMQYDCVVTGQVKMPVSAVVTQASDGRQLRWLLLLTVTCLGVVLLMTPACNLMKLAMMSRRHGTASDIISVRSQCLQRY